MADSVKSAPSNDQQRPLPRSGLVPPRRRAPARVNPYIRQNGSSHPHPPPPPSSQHSHRNKNNNNGRKRPSLPSPRRYNENQKRMRPDQMRQQRRGRPEKNSAAMAPHYERYSGPTEFAERTEQRVYMSASFESQGEIQGDYITRMLLLSMHTIEAQRCQATYFNKQASALTVEKINKGRANIDHVVHRLASPLRYSLLTNADREPDAFRAKIDQCDVCVFDVTPQCQQRYPMVQPGTAKLARQCNMDMRLRTIEPHGPTVEELATATAAATTEENLDDVSINTQALSPARFDDRVELGLFDDITTQVLYDDDDTDEERGEHQQRPPAVEKKKLQFVSFEDYEFEQEQQAKQQQAKQQQFSLLESRDRESSRVRRAEYYERRQPHTDFDREHRADRHLDPRVALELGYALGTKAPHQIVLVLNTAYARVEHLPSYLRSLQLPLFTYMMPNTHDLYKYVEKRDMQRISETEMQQKQRQMLDSKVQHMANDLAYVLKQSLYRQLVVRKFKELARVLCVEWREVREREHFTVLISERRYEKVCEIDRWVRTHLGLAAFTTLDYTPFDMHGANRQAVLRWAQHIVEAADTNEEKAREVRELTTSCGRLRFGLHAHWATLTNTI